MTGHKKPRGWRDLEEYEEIERVRPQHLPRVTTSPQEVLTTAVLPVHCSACLTEQDPDTQQLKIHSNVKRYEGEVVCKPQFFLCMSLAVFFYFTPPLFLPRTTSLVSSVVQPNISNDFQQHFLITRNRFKVSFLIQQVFSKSFLDDFFKNTSYQQNKWRQKHIL